MKSDINLIIRKKNKTVETGSHYANRSKQTNSPVYFCCLIRLTTTALTINAN